MIFYAFRNGFNATSRVELKKIVEFTIDKQVELHIIFATGCKNMKFDEKQAKAFYD